MILRRIGIVCALFLSSLCSVHAQGYLYATGSPVYSTSLPIDQGIVNVNNGEIHLEIPLATKQQRGDFQLNERLIYDSRLWKIVQSGSYSWQPTNVANSNGGWTFSSGVGNGNITFSTYGGTNPNTPDCSAGSEENYSQYLSWSWTDPTGTVHAFPAASTVQYFAGGAHCTSTSGEGNATSTSYASDGSGYVLNLSNYTTATVTDVHGTVYHPTLCGTSSCTSQNALVTDRNGNTWGTDASGNLTDTSGTVPVEVSTNGNSTYYDVLGVGGSRNRYTVTMETISFSTSFSETDVNEDTGSFQAIQSITLPDGSAYSFTYDSGTSSGHYGELTSMTLPTGGTIVYSWANFLDSFNNQNRWLQSVAKDGGTTTFTPSVVSKCSSSQGCQENVTVLSPGQNDTVYAFSLDSAALIAGNSWVQSINSYQGTTASGSLLRTTNTSYSYTNFDTETDENGTFYVTGSYNVPSSLTQYVTLADVGYTSELLTTLSPYSGLATEVKAWDFYNSTGNSPTTDTVTAYNAWNFPTSVVVKDGSGNQISSTTYGYDETTPTAAPSGLPNYTALGGNSRGNQTSQHQWINTSGATLSTTMTYDDAGTLLSVTPPEGTTQYGHDATDTFVTSTALPTPSSGVALTSGKQYDSSTGAVTSTTDANNQTVTYNTFDVFNRAQTVDNPDGGVTGISYTPTSASISASNSATGWTIKAMDTYGRPIRTNVATGVSSNPWYMQDTCYNTTGQMSFQSYRFQGQFSQAPVCTGAGDSYSYDGLSRVTQITHADGTAIHYSYKGRAVQTTDENGVSKIVQTDAFGRTTIVCEISSSSTMPASGSPVSCGTDIAGTGFVTSYSYNTASHTTTITQGAQTRVFQTDSLGRNVLAQEPESGSTTYSYAYNSTGLAVTRQKPQANQTSASTLTTTTTQYDSVDRVISITYSDGTPAKYFDYDTQGGWAEAQANVKGRLQKASSSIAGNLAATIFSYDPMGRVAFTGQCQPSGCYNAAKDKYTPYTWDYAGNLLSGGDGAGTTISYSYTPASETTGITSSQSDATHPGTLLENIANGPDGPLSFEYGNGLYEVRGYDTLGRLKKGTLCSGSSASGCSGGTELYGFSTIASGGRFLQVCDTVNNSCTNLGYDDLNRMTTQSTVTGATTNSTWSYDRYGNRWAQTTTHGGNPSVTFNTANNQEAGFSYDAAGNMTSDGVHHYSYDAEGNVTEVDTGSTATYYYDALNRRVRTVVGSSAYEFVFDLSGRRISTWNGTSDALLAENTYWGSLPLDFNQNNALHFQQQDWLGTSRMTTSYNGAVEGTYASLPFGDSLTTTGTDLDPYHYAMLDHDYESDLEHAQYRAYSSTQAHWMSPDPHSGSYNWGDPQSMNRYAYVENNPLALNDPSGLCWFCFTYLAQNSDGSIFVNVFDFSPAIPYIAAALGVGLAVDEVGKWLGWWGGPHFQGSLKPRPNVPSNGQMKTCTANAHGVENNLPTRAPNQTGAYGVPETQGTAAIDRSQWLPSGSSSWTSAQANAYINEYRTQISGYIPNGNGGFVQIFNGVSDNMGPASGVALLQNAYPGRVLFELPGGPNIESVDGMQFKIPSTMSCPNP